MMFKILNQRIHPFSEWESMRCINPSNYVRKGTLQVFHRIKRQFPNDYIVCIGYDRGETQFALTETFKRYEEKPEEVLDRCLQEECGVERNTFEKPNVFVYNEKHATIYCVPFRVTQDSLRPSKTRLPVEDQNINQNDDKTRKLVLIVHGDLNTIQNLFSRFYSSEKEIQHLVAISCKDIQNVFPKFFPQPYYSYPIHQTTYIRSSSPFTPVY